MRSTVGKWGVGGEVEYVTPTVRLVFSYLDLLVFPEGVYECGGGRVVLLLVCQGSGAWGRAPL